MSAAASPLEGAEGLCCFAASPTYHGTASSLASPDAAADFDPELASITTGRTEAARGACSSEASSEERERLLLRGMSMERAVGARVQVCSSGSHRPCHTLSSPLLSLSPHRSARHRPVLSGCTRRVQVRYMEREGTSLVCNEYHGTVVSVDPSRGLRVSFEGLRREWVNEHDDWAWLQAGDDDDGWDEGEELWGEEAAESRSSAELEPPLTKPTARKPRPPPRRPRPAFSRPSSALSGEGGEGRGEGACGGPGGATPLQPAGERAVRLGLRGFRGQLHSDAGDVSGSGMPRGLERLERGTALLEKRREAFLAHALTLTKGCSSSSSGEAAAEGEEGAKGRQSGAAEGRGVGSPSLKNRAAPLRVKAAAGKGGLHLSPGGSPAASPRAASSPRAAPLPRGDDSPLKSSPRSRDRRGGEMAGPRIEVGAAVFCHQVRRAMCTACAWQACAWHLHGVCTAWACHGQAHVQARVRAQHSTC